MCGVCVCAMCMHVKFREQSWALFFKHCLFLAFEIQSLTDLNSWLAGHWDSGICLSLSPQCWDYKQSPQNLAFCSSEDGIRSLCLDGKHFGNWGSLFQSELYFKGSNVLPKHVPQTGSHFVFSLLWLSVWRMDSVLFCISLQHHHLEHRHSYVNKGTVLLLQGRKVILSLVHSVESVRTAGRAWPPSEVWVTSQHWFNKMSGWLSEHDYERVLFWPLAFSFYPTRQLTGSINDGGRLLNILTISPLLRMRTRAVSVPGQNPVCLVRSANFWRQLVLVTLIVTVHLILWTWWNL